MADLSLAGQANLLRFLESGEFYKVGSTTKHKVNTRLVSATNRNLEELIEQKLFRKDLFFRLCVVKAKIPSLNERRDDILPLAKYFLDKFNKKFNKNIESISKEAQNLLLSHKFTGNVRELKNIIERATLIAQENVLSREDLELYKKSSKTKIPEPDNFINQPFNIPDNMPVNISDQGINLGQILEKTEKTYMEHALKLTRGNESKAARLLNMNHHTFRYRWKKKSIYIR